LWPEKQSTSMSRRGSAWPDILVGWCAIIAAPSTSTSAPTECASAATSWIGLMIPVTFETPVIAT
jgi:hypothetical protein